MALRADGREWSLFDHGQPEAARGSPIAVPHAEHAGRKGEALDEKLLEQRRGAAPAADEVNPFLKVFIGTCIDGRYGDHLRFPIQGMGLNEDLGPVDLENMLTGKHLFGVAAGMDAAPVKQEKFAAIARGQVQVMHHHHYCKPLPQV